MTEEDPALPPDPALLNRQPKWFKSVFYGAIVASILFCLALLVAPMTLRSRKNANQTQATSNARQIGLALFEFEKEYGTFPAEDTIALVDDSVSDHGFDLSGKSSNDLFRQLMAAGFTHSEDMFYAKVSGSMKPDGDTTPREALNKGEVGFAYISGLSSKDDPATPIAFAPIIPGTTKFEPDGFDKVGKAVILRLDGTVISYEIQKDGHIYDKGINLLSPKHPIWKGKAPDIRYPEL